MLERFRRGWVMVRVSGGVLREHPKLVALVYPAGGAAYFLREDAMTFLDIANFLEKIRVATSADEVIQIRELRNEIAHEYSNRDTAELLAACLSLSPSLFGMITRLEEYVRTASS